MSNDWKAAATVIVCCDKTLSLGWFYHKIAPPKRSVTFVVKGAFALRQGQEPIWTKEPALLAGDRYRDDDDTKSLLYPSDFAPFKPRADLLLVGSARAPGGQPASMLPVSWSVGDFSKTVDVYGNRAWKKKTLSRPTKSDPEPFIEMPLVYEKALGGPGFKKNPVGCGRQSESVPNLESPDQPVNGPSDSHDPAGFGPLAFSWEPRTSLVGTYKGNWHKERWPWFPKDFDWGFFNAAPRDQQIQGFLRGDEVLEFENLHPKHSVYRSRLPGLRALCFLNESQPNGTEIFREVPLCLDTLWIDMDAEMIVLVWRGHVDVRTAKLKETQHIFALTEPLAQKRLDLEGYRSLMWERLGSRARREREEEAALAAARQKTFGDMEIEAAKMEKEAAELEAQAAAREIESRARLIAAGVDPSQFQNSKPLSETIQEIRAQVEASRARLREVNPALADKAGPIDYAEFENIAPAGMEAPGSIGRGPVEAAVKQRASLARQDLSDLDLAGMDLTGMDLAYAILKNTSLLKANLAGTNLRGADLTGVNLTEADLSGAVLDEADLSEAIIANTKLSGVSLKGATLSGLDLQGVDLSGCDCSRCDFSKANLTGARFAGAKLSSANFGGCQLAKADFRRAELRAAQFEKVKAREIILEEADVAGIHAGGNGDFTKGNFKKVKGHRSIWEGGIFDQANFSQALLTGAQFSDSSLKESIFDRANLASAVFDDACLRKTVLTNANLLRASFERADLTEVNFQGSNLFEAGFFEAEIKQARLLGANVKSTLLS